MDRVQVASEGKRSETWVRVKRSMNPQKKRRQKAREREKQGAAARHPIESAFRYGGTMPGPRKVHSRCGAARAHGVVETLFSTASGPVSSVLRSQWGSTLLLVRALAAYSTPLL